MPPTKKPREAFDPDDLVETILARDVEIDRLKDDYAELRKDRDRWRDRTLPDGEAACIESCVRAVTILVDNGTNYAAAAKVERILKYLAARYGVDWPIPGAVEDQQIVAVVPPEVRSGDQIVVDVASRSVWRAP